MNEHIQLLNLMPEAFANQQQTVAANSGIWGKEISFSRGVTYLILAESGTGKSSLCNYLYGNRTDYSGQILLDNNNISNFSPEKWCALRRDTLSWMPQELDIFPELTVMENILIKNNLTGFRSRQWIENALDRMEIAEHARCKARMISVGQQQRLALIRALCQPFSFLILDEPVSHLDSRRSKEAAIMVAEETRIQGASVIATSVGNDIPLPDSITINL